MIAEAQRDKTRRPRSRGDTARISAARAAASDAGLLESGISVEDGGLDDVLARVLLDLGVLMTLTGGISLPVKAGAGPGARRAGDLQGAPRRVKGGKGIPQAAYTLARRAAAEVLSTGTYDSTDPLADVYGACPVRWERQEEEAS
jgi:hypothetical protein